MSIYLTNKQQQNILDQWQAMLSNNIMTLFEIPVINDDYMVTNIELVQNKRCIYLKFNVDDTLGNERYFSGDVKRINDWTYKIYVDQYNDNLDHYIEQVYSEVLDGFILPNNLCREEV